jgi:hypothetical protein
LYVPKEIDGVDGSAARPSCDLDGDVMRLRRTGDDPCEPESDYYYRTICSHLTFGNGFAVLIPFPEGECAVMVRDFFFLSTIERRGDLMVTRFTGNAVRWRERPRETGDIGDVVSSEGGASGKGAFSSGGVGGMSESRGRIGSGGGDGG